MSGEDRSLFYLAYVSSASDFETLSSFGNVLLPAK